MYHRRGVARARGTSPVVGSSAPNTMTTPNVPRLPAAALYERHHIADK